MNGTVSIRSQEHVERHHRSNEQHTYRCHYQIEVYQMVGRTALHGVIAFHIGHTQQGHQQSGKENLQSPIFNFQSFSLRLLYTERHLVLLYLDETA